MLLSSQNPFFQVYGREKKLSAAAAPRAPNKKFLSFTELSISYPSFPGQ